MASWSTDSDVFSEASTSPLTIPSQQRHVTEREATQQEAAWWVAPMVPAWLTNSPSGGSSSGRADLGASGIAMVYHSEAMVFVEAMVIDHGNGILYVIMICNSLDNIIMAIYQRKTLMVDKLINMEIMVHEWIIMDNVSFVIRVS